MQMFYDAGRIKLMHDLNEKCAVFGIYQPDEEVARLACFGLAALQHRGQESSGIVTSENGRFHAHIKPGLVAQVYGEDDLKRLKGSVAIGHNRYATSGSGEDVHSQPVLRGDGVLALAHNGNLPSITALQSFLKGKRLYKPGSNDSELMTDAIRYWLYQGNTIVEALTKAWPLFTGAFSCVMLYEDGLLAFRDTTGIRPLSLGTLPGGGYVVASETCAFDVIGARFERDIEPGELIYIHDGQLESVQIEAGHEKLEVFEYIYFARPDSLLQGQRVNEVRRRLGQYLAREQPAQADVVIPIPDSAIPAALGYAQEAGIPFDHGLIKNRYIHRTFIQPTQALREQQVSMKLNPITDIMSGKKVVLVDDSIVRGTTTRKIIQLMRAAGAAEVHVRVSSPPVLYPDFYGIDTPDQSQLLAARLTTNQAVAEHIQADSVGYLSVRGMRRAIDRPASSLCMACFTGEYPISLQERQSEVEAVRWMDRAPVVEMPTLIAKKQVA